MPEKTESALPELVIWIDTAGTDHPLPECRRLREADCTKDLHEDLRWVLVHDPRGFEQQQRSPEELQETMIGTTSCTTERILDAMLYNTARRAAFILSYNVSNPDSHWAARRPNYLRK